MADFYLKRHDTAPALIVGLGDLAGNLPAGTLAGASVKFIMKMAGAGATKINASASVVDAGGWKVGYYWLSTDTNASGDYEGEFEVTYADSTKQTFPDPGYIDILISDDLDDA